MKTKNFLPFFYLLINPIFAFQPVDINLASAEQIALLPGVGEKLALAIKAYQQQHGRFLNKEELLKVKGLTQKKLINMSDKLILVSPGRKKEPIKAASIKQKPIIPFEDLVQKALLSQGLSLDVDEDLKRRVRRFAWLPELSALADMGKNDLTTEKKAPNRNDLVNRDGADFGIGIKITFDLEKLIFNTSELEVQKLSLQRMKKREEMLEKLQRNYFRYLRLSEEVHEGKDSKTAQIELMEIAAELDFMSKNAFSQYLQSAVAVRP